MVRFVATTRDKGISLKELDIIQAEYNVLLFSGYYDFKTAKDYCNKVMLWIVNSLDISFSNVNQIIKECQYVISSNRLQLGALINIQSFVNIVNAKLPNAWKDSEWPSCKDLLKFSDIDIIEKGKDLVMDKTTKNEIQRVLNLKTASDIITTGTLALYYLEILDSIKMEYTLNTYDPHNNKQYILGKALQELHFCDRVILKTGEKIIEDKIKDYMEVLKELQENNTGHLGNNHIKSTIFGQVLPHENDIFI